MCVCVCVHACVCLGSFKIMQCEEDLERLCVVVNFHTADIL